MIITINNILDKFEQFTEDHYMLNDFGFGATYEIGRSRTMKYPYMWVTLENSPIEISNRTILPIINLTFIIADQVNIQKNVKKINGQDRNNGQEIISDSYLTAMDILSFIETDKFFKSNNILLTDNVSIEPAYDEDGAVVNAIVLRLGLKMPYINCKIPLKND